MSKSWVRERQEGYRAQRPAFSSASPSSHLNTSSITTKKKAAGHKPCRHSASQLLAIKPEPPQRHGDGERDKRPVVLVGAQAVQLGLADLRHHQVGVGVDGRRLAALLAAVGIVAADAQGAAQAVEDVGQRGHELGGDLDGAPAARERVDGRREVALDLVVDGLRDAREGRVQRGDELGSRVS